MPHVPAYADDCDDTESASCSIEPTCTTSTQETDSDDIVMTEQDVVMIEEAIRVANETSTRDVCTSLMLHPDGSNTALSVQQENNRKRHIGITGDHSEELEWLTTKYFRLVTEIKYF